MRILHLGSTGADVKKWQSFLFGQGYEYVTTDSNFGPDTERATKDFQDRNHIIPDGKVGNKTYAAAALKGFPVVSTNDAYPPKPDFAYPSEEQRDRMFGKFSYVRRGDGSIKVTDDWAKKNIVLVHIPQLAGIEGAPENCMIAFHRNGAAQLQALFAAWEKAGLLKYIRTWAGTYNPRMIRGSNNALSNHAFGAAFDINAAWNSLGVAPPLADQTGTVVPLVAIANAHGFYWGGHYTNRKDGMHFEVAVLNRFPKISKPAPTLQQTIKDVVEADRVKLDQTSSAAEPANGSPQVSPSKPVDAAGSDSPAAGDQSNAGNPANSTPPPINPPGDLPNAAPRQWLNVEDWKPFVFRMLKRVWIAFVGLVVTYVGGVITTAQNADYSDWRVWVVIAVIGVAFLLILAMFVTLIMLAVWHFNRKEIFNYKIAEIKSLIDPNVFNFGINFEKK